MLVNWALEMDLTPSVNTNNNTNSNSSSPMRSREELAVVRCVVVQSLY